MAIEIKELIDRGRLIEKGLTYLHSPDGVIRLYDAYRLANTDDYYSWKELSVRYLQLYYPADLERFIMYSDEFEKKHYIPRYISNMVGVLEACEALPSEKVILQNDTQKRESELSKVEELEEIYRAQTTEERVHKSGAAFHAWHAAACILFDKWFYPTDEDWIKFQEIEGDGNGYSLKHEYDKIYTPYKKLAARLREGRNIKGYLNKRASERISGNTTVQNKLNIFVSYAHADEKWLVKLQQHLKVLSKYYDEYIDEHQDQLMFRPFYDYGRSGLTTANINRKVFEESLHSSHGLPGALAYWAYNNAFHVAGGLSTAGLIAFCQEWSSMAILNHDMLKAYKRGGSGYARLDFNADPLSFIIALADTLEDFNRPNAKIIEDDSINGCRITYSFPSLSVELEETGGDAELRYQIVPEQKAAQEKYKSDDQRDLFDQPKGYFSLPSIGLKSLTIKCK